MPKPIRNKKSISFYVQNITHARLNALAKEMMRIPGGVIDFLVDREWKLRHPEGLEVEYEPYYERPGTGE